MTETKKQYCPVCKNEIYPLRQCSCVGGGDSADGKSYSQRSDELLLAIKNPKLTPEAAVMAVIADLMQKHQFFIDDNRALNTLSLRCVLTLLNDNQKSAVNHFVKDILRELENFKRMTGLTDKDCIVRVEKDKKGNIIAISVNIPIDKLYNQFLNHLPSTKHLPDPTIASVEETKFNPSPFKTQLKPGGVPG